MLSEQEYQQFVESCILLLDSLTIDQRRNDIASLESELSDPTIWTEDPDQAQQINKRLSVEKKHLEQILEFQDLVENLEIAFELADEDNFKKLYQQTQALKEMLEIHKYLNGSFDTHNALFSIHAGAGGVDAQDWAAMLSAMYQSFFKNQEWEVILISLSSGEEGGLKSITFEVRGEFAYGLLKTEAGVHRLVRLSPFNAGHTRETSFALVEIIPDNLESLVQLDDIDEKDLKWDTFMSSGKGGQSVNTTYSAVRVTHLPTGTTVTCQNERNQIQNKQTALKYLQNKLAVLKLRELDEMKNEIRGEFHSAEWGNQIRNYVLHPYKLIKDSRSGWETSEVDKVLTQGDLLPIIWSVKQAENP